jgi:hypothetical protein
MTIVRYSYTFAAFFLLIFRVNAGLYYDAVTCSSKSRALKSPSANCQRISDFLDTAFMSGFRMNGNALAAIGRPPWNGAPPGALWEFPDSVARDLAGRIYGDGTGAPILTDKLTLVRVTSNMLYIVEITLPKP